MARIVPAGSLSWTPSTSPDVVGYRVYYQEGEAPTYDSPFAAFVTVSSVLLPLEGQSPVEGQFFYGVSAIDQKGNESDIVPLEVTLDTTPPAPPTDVIFTP